MAYKVTIEFADLKDDKHVYKVGDTYPRSGAKPTSKRITELASDKNRLGYALITEIKTRKRKENADDVQSD